MVTSRTQRMILPVMAAGPTTVPAGAMIFNTNSSYPAAGGSCGSISAQSGGGFDVYAMTTGTYAGMALYQDAACSANVISVQSNGSYDFHGTLYAPTAVIDWSESVVAAAAT